MTVTYESDEAFVTYSKNDSKVKFWNKIRKAKESLLSVEEVYWNCCYEF